MSSVSTDVLTHFDSNSLINGIAGYYVSNEGTQHIVVGTSDSNGDSLTEVYWKSGQGVHQDVLTHFDVAITPVGAYYVSEEGTQHVIVTTRVGDLIEVYWKSGQGVKQDTLTSFASSAAFTGFSSGYYASNEGTQHIVVGTMDLPVNPTVGIITDVSWKSGQGVEQRELARFGGSLNVIGAYYVPEEDSQHVIVISPDGNLTEMYWKSGQSVTQDVLISRGSTPLTTLKTFSNGSSGTAFYSADDHTQHVVLVSADGTLTDVHWQSGQGIHQDVLTQLSSLDGITGYYSVNDRKRHVVCYTRDGALIEVYW